MTARAARAARAAAGSLPLSPGRKWQAITLATLLLVPAYWSILAGLVAAAGTEEEAVAGPDPGPSLAFGLALIPFVFVALAFLSQHPRAPAAVVKALLLTVLVGAPVSAIAGDAVTGIVAGVGAGGIVALRAEPEHSWRARAVGVAIAVLYTFVLVRMASSLALLPAPVFPFTAVGIADHLSERRRALESQPA